MRMPKIRQSVLRYPLNELVASEANVRLLRVLSTEAEGPISAADAARRAELSLPGTTAALAKLVATGFVVRVGGGRSPRYELRCDGRLVPALAELFRAEQLRFEELTANLRDVFSSLAEVRSAWIQRPPLEPAEPLVIHSMVEIDSVSWVKQELRSRVEPLEKDFDIVVELAFHTEADPPAEDARAEVLLAGVPPSRAETSRPRIRSHSDLDARARRMAEGVARLLQRNPSLVRAAKTHLDRLLREGQGAAEADLLEWRRILDTYSNERLRDLLTSTSSRADRLRQSAPFFSVLSPKERDELMVYLEEHT